MVAFIELIARILELHEAFGSFRGNSMVDQLQDYFLWGCVVTEVELDVLTGEKKVCWSRV